MLVGRYNEHYEARFEQWKQLELSEEESTSSWNWVGKQGRRPEGSVLAGRLSSAVKQGWWAEPGRSVGAKERVTTNARYLERRRILFRSARDYNYHNP